MIRVALICLDKPDNLATRMAHREAHFAYVAETGVVEFGGPFLDEAGTMIGSMMVVQVENMQAAKDWSSRDPYVTGGVFATVEFREWKRLVG